MVRNHLILILFSETCFGPEDSNCNSCRNGLNRVLNGNKCNCIDSYYSANGTLIC